MSAYKRIAGLSWGVYLWMIEYINEFLQQKMAAQVQVQKSR